MTDDTEALADEVRRVIIETTNVELKPEDIGLGQALHGPDSLGLHSLEIFELILELETRFSVEIREDEVRRLNSVSAIVALVESRRRG